MKHKTKLNLATLDEAVLQRYYFEQMAFGSTETRRSLLPPFLKEKASQFKAIIKERGTESGKNTNNKNHRPDFLLIFSHNTYNAEVKWKSSQFNHPPSLYKNKRGFLIALNNDYKQEKHQNLQGIEIVTVEQRDFERWFIINSHQLLKDHLQAKGIGKTTTEKYWIVYLGTRVATNIETGIATGTWAFKNDKNVNNIIRIRKNDKIIFLRAGNLRPNAKQQCMVPDAQFDILKMTTLTCTGGHYFNTEPKGTCFEPKTEIRDREYIHFIDIKQDDKSTSWTVDEIKIDSREEYGITEEARRAIRDSYNNKGAPYEISEDSYQELVQAARHSKRKNNIK
jgi:hypothetical protein